MVRRLDGSSWCQEWGLVSVETVWKNGLNKYQNRPESVKSTKSTEKYRKYQNRQQSIKNGESKQNQRYSQERQKEEPLEQDHPLGTGLESELMVSFLESYGSNLVARTWFRCEEVATMLTNDKKARKR